LSTPAGDREDEDRRLAGAFLASRSEAAFHALYARHARALYGLARRLLGAGAAEIDDVVQEAWVRAIAGLPRFGWRSSLRTWMCGIVVNCCRERWQEHGGASDPAEGFVLDTSDRLPIEQAVARLAPGHRAVLVLHDVYGYTHEEIGALLGIDAGTSKSQLSRARGCLRGILRPVAAGGDER
jgi:RNA polymerase sigma-70 factor (ECF subfamily)